MNRQIGKRDPFQIDRETRDHSERRRIGQVVHDERGSAHVEWRDAPDDYQRQKFEIQSTEVSGRDDTKLRRGFEPRLEVRVDDTFNPYDRKPETFGGNAAACAPKGAKRDLKKLSAWLKLMREMEERKKNGESE